MIRKERILRWEVEFDPEATREAYLQIENGGADGCSCGSCRNFAGARGQAFPPSARAIFETLGIDYRKEREVYLVAPDKARGIVLNAGWFHFIGKLVSGRDAVKALPGRKAFAPDLEPLGEGFAMGFTNQTRLTPEAFRGQPVVQVEFSTAVPWVLGEPFDP